jgi:RNA polymerase sigma-70 factor (ECF subfamily)
VSALPVPAPTLLDDERQLLAALRVGDEQAFGRLVEQYHGSLLRVARTYVRTAASAEEVVQDTWLGVLRGLDSFRGDSSLKTWIFRILANQAKTRALRERRSVPFSALVADDGWSAADEDRFLPEDHPEWPGHWASAPASWRELPEQRLLAGETLECIRTAIEALPTAQRQVISLRDVEGWPAEEVCELLGLSDGNQRILLHRARSKVRAALEAHLDPERG